jgi:hypothetical protein
MVGRMPGNDSGPTACARRLQAQPSNLSYMPTRTQQPSINRRRGWANVLPLPSSMHGNPLHRPLAGTRAFKAAGGWSACRLGRAQHHRPARPGAMPMRGTLDPQHRRGTKSKTYKGCYAHLRRLDKTTRPKQQSNGVGTIISGTPTNPMLRGGPFWGAGSTAATAVLRCVRARGAMNDCSTAPRTQGCFMCTGSARRQLDWARSFGRVVGTRLLIDVSPRAGRWGRPRAAAASPPTAPRP